MNPLVIVGIIAVLFAGATGVVGKLLLDSHEKIGDLKVTIRDRQAVIDQNKHDANPSSKLDEYQQAVERLLRANTAKTTQAINNAPTDDDAAAAALAGVLRARAAAQRGGTPAP